MDSLNVLLMRFSKLADLAREEQNILKNKLKAVDGSLTEQEIDNLLIGLTKVQNASVMFKEILNFYTLKRNSKSYSKDIIESDFAAKLDTLLMFQFFISSFSGIEFSCKQFVLWKIDLPEFSKARKIRNYLFGVKGNFLQS